MVLRELDVGGSTVGSGVKDNVEELFPLNSRQSGDVWEREQERENEREREGEREREMPVVLYT